jgi:hypothetical protein
MFIASIAVRLRTPAGCYVSAPTIGTRASDEHCTPLGCDRVTMWPINIAPLWCGPVTIGPL